MGPEKWSLNFLFCKRETRSNLSDYWDKVNDIANVKLQSTPRSRGVRESPLSSRVSSFPKGWGKGTPTENTGKGRSQEESFPSQWVGHHNNTPKPKSSLLYHRVTSWCFSLPFSARVPDECVQSGETGLATGLKT